MVTGFQLQAYWKLKKYAIDTIARSYGYWTDTHPRTESQYRAQKFLAGVSPWYNNWMYTRAKDEWTSLNRQALGIGWSDIASPWLASLSGNNISKLYGGTMSTVSKNIGRLYK